MSVLMRTIRAILMPAILGLALAVAPPSMSIARAATITAPALHILAHRADAKKADVSWPTDPVLCDLVLDGNVAEGDAKAIEQAFKSLVRPEEQGVAFFLCLRSDGGDLREAVEIARFVLRSQRPSITPVVEDGRTCASACAVIFLSGMAPARVGGWPHRFLHPRGKLLFHSSQLDVNRMSDEDVRHYLGQPDPNGIRGRVAKLYADGLSDAQSVIATFQQLIMQREDVGDHWVRPSLFLEMFGQAPDEWLCIDTVDAVGRWNIQVYGYRPPEPPRQEHYSNLCRAAYHWRSDQFAVDAEIDLREEGELKQPPAATPIAGRIQSKAGFDERYTIPFEARMGPVTCVVELKHGWDSGTRTYKKQLDDSATLTAFFVVNEPTTPASVLMLELAPAGYYPAATLLHDLPGLRAPPDWAAPQPRPAVEFADHPNRVMNGCAYRAMPKTDRDACAAACATDAACRGYSHHKITRTCELKHTLTALRRNPLWSSGTPSPGPAAAASVRAPTMALYPADGDAHRDYKLVGKLIDDAKVREFADCTNSCKSDQACVAIQYGTATDTCRRFSEVTGSQTPPPQEEATIIAVKRQ
jgi:hypothetical protein